MKPRHLIILSIILVMLAAGVVYKQFQKPPELSTQEYAPLDLSFDTAQVAKIGIVNGKGDKLAELVKEGGKWKIADFFSARADKEKIEAFLKEIREVKGEMRASGKSLFSDFGIEDDKAFRVVLSNEKGEVILNLALGTKKPNYNTTFVRRADQDTVYLAAANLYGKMGLWGDPEKESPKNDFWTDLRLIDFKVDDVSKVETHRFKDGKDVMTAGVLRETDPSDSAKKIWKYVGQEAPFAIEADKVKQFLTTFRDSRATKAVDPKAKDYGFAKPRFQMKLGIEGGQEMTVTVGDENAETKAKYVQISSEPVVYELGEYYFNNNMDVDNSKFFAANPLGVDPDKTVKLAIQTDKKSLSFNPREKKSDPVTGYLNDLKTFQAARLLFDPADEKKVKSPSRFFVDVQKEGEASVVLDAGELVSEEKKEYACLKRGNPRAFAISEQVYKKLFDNLTRLEEKKEEKKEANKADEKKS